MCKEKKEWGTLPYTLLILLQSVLYGFGNPLSKIGFESITVLWCLGIRFSGAAALLLLFGRRTVRTLRAAPLKAWLPVQPCHGGGLRQLQHGAAIHHRHQRGLSHVAAGAVYPGAGAAGAEEALPSINKGKHA